MYALFEQALISGPYPFCLGMLLDISLKSIMILVVAIMAALALLRASAAIRHMVWALALLSLLALPFFVVTLPPLPVTLPQMPAYSGRVAAMVPEIGRLAGTAPERAVLALGGVAVNMERPQQPMDISPGIPAAVSTPASTNGISPLQTSHGFPWPAVVVGLWATGVALMLAVLGVHTWRRQRLARASRVVQEGLWCSLFQDLAQKMRLKRSVVLLEGEHAGSPMTWGFLRPVVLVPVQARHWPASQRRDVLLHELAHIKRCDHLIQFLAQLACALYWFNPLVWLAVRRLWVEQEKACDDQVLNAGVQSSEYGGLLMRVARSFRSPRGAGWVAVPMARSSRLAGRIQSILDEGCNRMPAHRRWWIGAGFVVALLVFPLAAASLKNGGDSASTQEPAGDDRELVLEEWVEDMSKLPVETRVAEAANEAVKTRSTPRNEPAPDSSENKARVEQTVSAVKQEKQEEKLKTYEEQLQAQQQLRAQEEQLRLQQEQLQTQAQQLKMYMRQIEEHVVYNRAEEIAIQQPVLIQLSSHRAEDSDASWSPDGKWIAFTSSRSGNYDIWLKPAAGGEAIQLTNDPSWDRYAVWSSDGTELAFTSSRVISRQGENSSIWNRVWTRLPFTSSGIDYWWGPSNFSLAT